MGNHLSISNSLWDPWEYIVHLKGKSWGTKDKGESKVHYCTRQPKAAVVCQLQKGLTMVSGCCITTSPSGCSCLLWPRATLMQDLSKPSLTQCTLIKHTALHCSPLCCILSQGSSKPDWTVLFLASPYGRESNPVKTLLGVSAFSICQVFFIFRSLRSSRCNYTGLSLCFQCLLHQRNLPLK